MGILFSAPQKEYEIIRDKWLERCDTIARKGVFVGGPDVAKFEKKFAEYTGAKHTIGVGNGTDALYLVLKALGIGPGDEVITACNTFVATVEAIHHTGATPVLVDCEKDTFLIDLASAMKKKTAKTKAIIPVHLYGQMADMEAITQWAEAEHVFVVEDCAQAAGAEAGKRKAGTWGIAGCFSFFPEKNLGALGDAGGIITSDNVLAEKIKKLRNHGGDGKYVHEVPGFNSRLDPIQAVCLELKLDYLDEWTAKRIETAKQYRTHLAGFSPVTLPSFSDNRSHVFHLFVVRVAADKRDFIKKELMKKGILSAIQYPVPVHLTPAFSYLGHKKSDMPVAEQYAGEIISLPMHIGMTEDDVRFIAGVLREIAG